jgi:hypothetical protein
LTNMGPIGDLQKIPIWQIAIWSKSQRTLYLTQVQIWFAPKMKWRKRKKKSFKAGPTMKRKKSSRLIQASKPKKRIAWGPNYTAREDMLEEEKWRNMSSKSQCNLIL